MRTTARRARRWQVMKPLVASGLSARDLETWLQAVALGGSVHTMNGDVKILSPAKAKKLVVCFSNVFCADPDGLPIARAYGPGIP